MQINNWSGLLNSQRLSKVPRDINNDLVIIGTNTAGGFKKQDTWQPYTMTLADLAAAIGGGGGGGGVNFKLEAGNYIELFDSGDLQSGAFTPTQNGIVKIAAIGIPNGLRWRGEFTTGTPTDSLGNYLVNDVVYVDTGSSYTTYFAKVGQTVPGATAPPTSGYSNTEWAQLGEKGDNGYRTAVLEMFRWSAAAPTTYPSGTSVYTWSTGTWTNPGTLNSWSQTIPTTVQGQTLWRIKQIYTDKLIDPTTAITWSSTTVEPLSYAGLDGAATVQGFTTRNSNFSVAAGMQNNMQLINTSLTTPSTTLTITVPSIDNTIPVGSQLLFSWDAIDAGQTTSVVFAAGTNSTIKVPDNMLYLRSLYSTACLTKQSYSAPNTVWYLTGDLINTF
jgi:hypothetical protein